MPKPPRPLTMLSILSLAALMAAGPLPSAAAAPNPATAASTAQAGTAIKLTLDGKEFAPKSQPFSDAGTVYLPLRDIGELLGTVVVWNRSARTVVMTYPERVITLKLGASEAVRNGTALPLSSPLRIVDGRVYVPLRFFTEAIGAGVSWDPANRTVAITRWSAYERGSGSNATVWFNRVSGELYAAHPYEAKPVPVGKIDAKIEQNVTVRANLLGDGGMIVTVTDNYGTPRVNFNVYAVYIKDDAIVRQAKASYYLRYEQNAVSYDDAPVLTDGKTLAVLNADGSVAKEYNLPALGGKDESYSVLAIGDAYMIIRPNRTGFLTLVNLRDNSAVLLYKTLLPERERKFAEKNAVPYRGDELRFNGEAYDGTLVFSYRSRFDGKDYEVKYTLDE